MSDNAKQDTKRELTIIDQDSWWAVYIDGELVGYNDYYAFGADWLAEHLGWEVYRVEAPDGMDNPPQEYETFEQLELQLAEMDQ